MVTKTVIVKNAQGLHMRPAGILAAEMKKFAGCTVTLKTAEKTAKASAVMCFARLACLILFPILLTSNISANLLTRYNYNPKLPNLKYAMRGS